MIRFSARRAMSYAGLLLIGFLAVGCAMNNSQDYEKQMLSLPISSGRAIAVATQDERPLVLKGEEREHYIGHQRGGYGNPFVVTTKGLKPLAGVVTQVVSESIQQKGAKTVAVPIPLRTSEADVQAALRSSKADRWLLITLREWDSNTYMNTDLDYDLLAQVFDAEGRLLASNEMRQKDNIRSSGLGSSVHSKQIPQAFRERMERLLSNPQIIAALQ